MQSELKKAKIRQDRRKKRVRAPLIRSNRLRLSIDRSLNNVYGQIINDRESKTLLGVSTLNKELKSIKNKTEKAKKAGQMLAELAKKQGIDKVVFDRGYYTYHGRIAAFADGAREAGLVF